MREQTRDVMRRASGRPALRRGAAVMLIALSAQFLAGMIVNLFVVVPTDHPGAGTSPYFTGVVESVLWSFSSGIPLLVAHVVLGILLFAGAIWIIVVSIQAKVRATQWLSGVGLFGVIFAGFNGASFLKFNLDVSSMLMSIGFTLAMVAYSLILAVV